VEFKIGDSVQLKEGQSPIMVISRTKIEHLPEEVECRWYLKKEGEFKSEIFHKDMLKHYKERGLLDKH